MATYAVVIFPDADTEETERFRDTWDPQSTLISAHITIVFPFDWPGSPDDLITLLAPTAQRHRRFRVHLDNPTIWDDEYLFLLATQGDAEIRQLHDALYEAPLGMGDEPGFTPHMTIARQRDPAALREAQRQAASLAVLGWANTLSIFRVEPGAKRRGVADIPFSPRS